MCMNCGRAWPKSDPQAEFLANNCEQGHDIFQVHPIMEAGQDMPIAVEVTRKTGDKTVGKAIYERKQVEPIPESK